MGVSGACRNLAYERASLGVHDVDGIGEFRGNIQQSVRPKVRAVRTNVFAEVDDGDGPPLAQVHDVDGASVGGRLSHPRVSVDRNIAEATVRGDSDLVSVNVNPHCGLDLFGYRIHKQDGVLHLVRNQKKIVWSWVSRNAARKQKTCEKGNAQEAVVHDCPLP